MKRMRDRPFESQSTQSADCYGKQAMNEVDEVVDEKIHEYVYRRIYVHVYIHTLLRMINVKLNLYVRI